MSGLKSVQYIFLRDGIEGKKMRNVSCFKILIHVNNQLHFFKKVSKTNLLLVQQSLPNLRIKTSYSAYEFTKWLTQ